MGAFGSIGAVNGLLRNAVGLVHELKQPRISNKDFADILRTSLAAKATEKADEAKASKLGEKLLQTRDADRNGKLSIEESGFDKQTFARFDTDGDGQLSLGEIRPAMLSGLQGTEGGTATKG
jgi:Ca2+-binding EF-hand superfamily protein